MTEPRTEAGRRLLLQLAEVTQVVRAKEGSWQDAILAIEAEAWDEGYAAAVADEHGRVPAPMPTPTDQWGTGVVDDAYAGWIAGLSEYPMPFEAFTAGWRAVRAASLPEATDDR